MRELRATINATASPSASSTAIISATANKHNLWKSPIPYLFGSLALMFILITGALVLLICSYHKRSYGGRTPDDVDDDDRKPSKATNAVDLHAEEPKIVVIMAGDNNPTYLATPVQVGICSTTTHDDHDHDEDHGDDHQDRRDV